MSKKSNDPNQPDTAIVVTGKKRKGIIVTCAVAVVVLLAVGAGLLLTLPKSADARNLQEKLELGSKYLSELDYEQAVAVYKAAIEIDPKCADAYIGLAEVYTAMGEYEKAEEILDTAWEKVEKKQDLERISDKKTEVGALKESAPQKRPEDNADGKEDAAPSPEPSGSLSSVTKISKAKVGDTVTFGSYEQDNDLTNGKEAIEWIVLDKQDGKVLLLSKYALDEKPYNETDTDVTWETCTLRSWLNEDFYTTAFSKKERGYIAETLVKNEDNPYWGNEGGNDTRDKVFLLSIGEATTYFDPDADAHDPARRAKVTEYAKAQGGWAYNEAEYGRYGTTEYDGNGGWWLRSPGYDSELAVCVLVDGNVSEDGYVVTAYDAVVRPALWIAP